MKTQELIFTNDPGKATDAIVGEMKPSKVIVLTDRNTRNEVLPRLQAMSAAVASADIITVKAGDMNKNIDSLQSIWLELGNYGATRDSMLINLGGGVITDMGAFAACTFKRGIKFINMPTTLLGAVDAAVGGKTGINFGGLKNQVGSFSQAEKVVISSLFFNTLPVSEIKSGYAEMIKHAMISSEKSLNELLDERPDDISSDRMLELLKESVLIKKGVVDRDPLESGLRKSLNFGHTAGHAFESLAMERESPIPHGYAVAYGMITELVISHMKLGFPSETVHRYSHYVRDVYGPFEFTCDDYGRLLDLMGHDKKNKIAGEINFTLLYRLGDVRLDCIAGVDDIKAALDITRDEMGI